MGSILGSVHYLNMTFFIFIFLLLSFCLLLGIVLEFCKKDVDSELIFCKYKYFNGI
jgi:hypothetical protein